MFEGKVRFVRRKSSGQSKKSARLFEVFSSLISNVIIQAVVDKCIEPELAYNSILSPKKRLVNIPFARKNRKVSRLKAIF